jgi:hypothetical protein
MTFSISIFKSISKLHAWFLTFLMMLFWTGSKGQSHYTVSCLFRGSQSANLSVFLDSIKSDQPRMNVYMLPLHYLPKNYNGYPLLNHQRVSRLHTHYNYKGVLYTSWHMFSILLFFFAHFCHMHFVVGIIQTFLACHFYSQWDHDC